MSNILTNTTELQEVLEILQTKAAGGEQATPVISVNSLTGLITATAGTKFATEQLPTQAVKIITPSTTEQTAVNAGVYTTGVVKVAAVPTQTKTATPKSAPQIISPDSGKFLSGVTVAGDPGLVADNIKNGVSIFGITGTLSTSGSSLEVFEQDDWAEIKTFQMGNVGFLIGHGRYTYNYYEGMTWGEWVNSGFNTDEYYIADGIIKTDKVLSQYANRNVVVTWEDNVAPEEIIDADVDYRLDEIMEEF